MIGKPKWWCWIWKKSWKNLIKHAKIRGVKTVPLLLMVYNLKHNGIIDHSTENFLCWRLTGQLKLFKEVLDEVMNLFAGKNARNVRNDTKNWMGTSMSVPPNSQSLTFVENHTLKSAWMTFIQWQTFERLKNNGISTKSRRQGSKQRIQS